MHWLISAIPCTTSPSPAPGSMAELIPPSPAPTTEVSRHSDQSAEVISSSVIAPALIFKIPKWHRLQPVFFLF